MKKEAKKNDEDKCLYTCESIVDANEYKKAAKYFPKFYWYYVFKGTILNIIMTSFVAIISRSLTTTIVVFIISQIYMMITYRIRLEHHAERSFNSWVKKGFDTEIHSEFYDDYLIRKSESESLKIRYDEIDKCVETDTNFYLQFNKKNTIIFIQKSACKLELISFLREKFKNLENHSGEQNKVKIVKKQRYPSFIKDMMILLFVATLLSLYGASWSLSLIDNLIPQHGFGAAKNCWIFFCWLPVPALSIILGFKYKKQGIKCTKNIVGGFIIGILLLMGGALSLSQTYFKDYSEINAYRDIIDAELPNNGELEILNWVNFPDDSISNKLIINVWYDKEDVTKLVSGIESSPNWILSKEIESKLKIFIPSELESDDDAYYSIYNKNTNEYNTLPEVSGNYEIYAMKYDKSEKCLKIHKFNYLYK